MDHTEIAKNPIFVGKTSKLKLRELCLQDFRTFPQFQKNSFSCSILISVRVWIDRILSQLLGLPTC